MEFSRVEIRDFTVQSFPHLSVQLLENCIRNLSESGPTWSAAGTSEAAFPSDLAHFISICSFWRGQAVISEPANTWQEMFCGEARKRQRQQSSLHGAVLEEPPVTSLMSSLQVSTCLLLISSSRQVLSQRTAAAVVKTCCYFCQKLPEISARLKLQPEAAELTALGEAERPLNQHLCVWSELPWQPEEAQAGTGMFMGCHW